MNNVTREELIKLLGSTDEYIKFLEKEIIESNMIIENIKDICRKHGNIKSSQVVDILCEFNKLNTSTETEHEGA